MHLYQGYDIISTLLAVLVTGLGGILYSWMYVEWNYRLWISISLHTFMDVAWMILPVGEEGYGAAGNIATNVGRTITVALAIGATIYFKRKRG
jgi:predicted membrane channel-forming protein YqfA (hemolysin III family)